VSPAKRERFYRSPRPPGKEGRRPNTPQTKVKRRRAYSDSVQARRLVLPLNVDRYALRLWRRKRYMGQGDLAALLDLSWMTITRWEHGESSIPSYIQLVLERLDEIMLWHPDGPRLKEGQQIVPIEVATPPPPGTRIPAVLHKEGAFRATG
jgi:ribosome-binding protein aMBF1 (putative translation factor)